MDFRNTKTRSKHSRPGFTIVELLIVIVVIGILAAITIVAYNGIQNRAKQSALVTEISQWKKKSELYKIENSIECPENYVFVYGNVTLGTSDFCVMKYEAKIQGNDNGQTSYTSSMVADSRATGTPWVNLTQTNAIAEASALGGNSHLLTEAEWMTIAADVLSVKHNWSGGAVGSGYIYSGHNDNSPVNALTAVTDDNDSYNGTGNSSTSGDNQKRTLYLSSGDVIWDIAGNVWEWTATAQAMSNVGVSGDSAFTTRDWTLGTLSLGNLPAVSRPGALSSLPGLSNVTNWNPAQGVGRINANYADTATRAFIRGGSWSTAGAAGVLALNLSLTPSSTNMVIGFRVAR